MDAVAVDVNNFHAINEQYGKSSGDRVLRSIGERLRTLSRELGGVGSRQGEDTFLMYCPHREDYQELLTRLSELPDGMVSCSDGLRATAEKRERSKDNSLWRHPEGMCSTES